MRLALPRQIHSHSPRGLRWELVGLRTHPEPLHQTSQFIKVAGTQKHSECK